MASISDSGEERVRRFEKGEGPSCSGSFKEQCLYIFMINNVILYSYYAELKSVDLDGCNSAQDCTVNCIKYVLGTLVMIIFLHLTILYNVY